MNMIFERKLKIPKEVKEMYPLTPEMERTAAERVSALKKIFSGEDDRFILIIGPCSADNEESVLDYAARLRKAADKVSDKLFIVPRVFTNKPRTTGFGYKGLVHQPDPGEKPDMFRGIVATRELHMRVLRETGMSGADEMLYPENHRYINDIVCYVTVGARSVENQQHRLTASGLNIPVGMKNPTAGSVSVMMNAISAAQQPHTFIYRGWEVHSQGNPYAHAVLRGYKTPEGRYAPNYGYADLAGLSEAYAAGAESGLDFSNPAVIVDTNHGNSGKDPFAQPEIAMDVLASRRKNSEIARLVKGMMIESYIEDGCQPAGGRTYGRSITDACLGWEKTERLIYEIAEKL